MTIALPSSNIASVAKIIARPRMDIGGGSLTPPAGATKPRGARPARRTHAACRPGPAGARQLFESPARTAIVQRAAMIESAPRDNGFLSLVGFTPRGPRPLSSLIFVVTLGLAASVALLINLGLSGRTDSRDLLVLHNLAFVALSSTVMLGTFLLLADRRRGFRPGWLSLATAFVTGLVALAYSMARTGHRSPTLPEVLLFVGHAVNVGLFVRLGIAFGASRLPGPVGIGLATFIATALSGLLNALNLWFVAAGMRAAPPGRDLALRVLAAAIGAVALGVLAWPAGALVRRLESAVKGAS